MDLGIVVKCGIGVAKVVLEEMSRATLLHGDNIVSELGMSDQRNSEEGTRVVSAAARCLCLGD